MVDNGSICLWDHLVKVGYVEIIYYSIVLIRCIHLIHFILVTEL
jgi:hypothetical protein